MKQNPLDDDFKIDGIPIDDYRVNMAKIPDDELLRLYKEEQKSIFVVARHFKCSYRTIYRRLTLLGISLNERKFRTKKIKNFLGKKQLAQFSGKDITVEDMAKKLRTTPDIVRRYLHKYGI